MPTSATSGAPLDADKRAKSGAPLDERRLMDWKIELIMVPVTDVDRAKAFYVDQVGFNADYDHVVSEDIRFVQLTPPGSACSVAIGKGLTDMAPGSQRGIQVVVPDVEDARRRLAENGVEVTEIDDMPWGRFAFFRDPDGNAWALQQIPPRDKNAETG
jgi:predicted enzyme related to lactoylglutathione lyase